MIATHSSVSGKGLRQSYPKNNCELITLHPICCTLYTVVNFMTMPALIE
uniref:Uncharacterized protein n=1 Tax=Anguilla anguilla TaxID=7936 RepID=A0A0E9RG57_ANGAN